MYMYTLSSLLRAILEMKKKKIKKMVKKEEIKKEKKDEWLDVG